MLGIIDSKSVGIDISSNVIKGVVLDKKGKEIKLKKYGTFKLRKDIFSSIGIKNIDELKYGIKGMLKLLKEEKIEKITTVLPESLTFVKLIHIDVSKIEEKGLKNAIKEEMINHLPYQLDEVYYNYELIYNQNLKNKTAILIGACPKKTVEDFITVFENLDILIENLEIEANAILRSIFPLEFKSKDSYVVLDLGAKRSSLIIAKSNIVQFTVSLPFSAEKFTKKIMNELKLSYKQAEKAKHICGIDPEKCEGALYKILISEINEFSKKINDSINFYSTHFPGSPKISKIYITGGGSYLNGIEKVIYINCGIQVEKADPLRNIKNKIIPLKERQMYTTAIGLGLSKYVSYL